MSSNGGQYGSEETKTPRELLELEAKAEKDRAAFVAEGKSRLLPKCPECGSIGTLELVDGVTRCIDCDEVVAATTKLSGFGRR